MSFFLGIDIGSTAVKACLIRGGGMPSVAGRGSSAYPTFRNGPLAEQDPLDWNRAAADAVLELPQVLPVEEAIDRLLIVLESKVISQ